VETVVTRAVVPGRHLQVAYYDQSLIGGLHPAYTSEHHQGTSVRLGCGLPGEQAQRSRLLLLVVRDDAWVTVRTNLPDRNVFNINQFS